MPGRAHLAPFLLLLVAAVAAPSRAEARESLLMSMGALAIVEPTENGGRDGLYGVAAGVALLDHESEIWRVEPGFELQGSAAFGRGARWQADWWLGFVATWRLTPEAINPFIALGPTLGYFARSEDTNGWGLGVRGDIGFHGILGDSLYWRAGIGVMGPGIGGFRSELSVGYAIR